MSDSWKEFKKAVEGSLGDFGELTPAVLTYGLSSEIGELFDLLRKDIINKSEATKDVHKKASEIGDILWYIAALETFYELPSTRNSGFFDFTLSSGDLEVNLIEVHADILRYSSEISGGIIVNDIDEIHYNLNKVISCLFDLCVSYDLSIKDCLAHATSKIDIRHPKGFDKDAKKNYESEYEASKAQIEKMGSKEVLLEIETDAKSENLYKYNSLTVTPSFDEGNKIVYSHFKDIILDFFTASNFLAENYKNVDYRINYGPNFRKLLSEHRGSLTTGFIEGDKLITALEARDKLNSKSSIVFSKDRSRPILMNTTMKELDDLLDYIEIARSKN